jgi:DNA-binding CsgD family transcriptional regulator
MVPLTGPQMRLVHCLCQGMTNDAAATHLGITPPTVRTQLRTVLDITGATCDRDLIAQILTGRLTPIEDTD